MGVLELTLAVTPPGIGVGFRESSTQSESAKPPPDISRFLLRARYLAARIVEGKAKAPGKEKKMIAVVRTGPH